MKIEKFVMTFVGLAIGTSHAQVPDRPKQFATYELRQNTGLTESDARVLSESFRSHRDHPTQNADSLSAKREVDVYSDESDTTRVLYRYETSTLEVLPDLVGVTAPAPSAIESRRLAQVWLRKSALWRKEDEELKSDEVTTLTKQSYGSDGASDGPIDAIQSVHFYQMIDGLRVYGPSSTLVVDVGNSNVVGFYRDLRSYIPSSRKAVTLKTEKEATLEFYRLFGSELDRCGNSIAACKVELLIKLIYYEQGRKFIQPAYEFIISSTTSEGAESGSIHIIAAARKSPEPIIEPQYSQLKLPKMPYKASPPEIDGNPTYLHYGMYVVRKDKLYPKSWTKDAWAFHTNFVRGNEYARSSKPGRSKPLEEPQYFWNHRWLWEAEGVDDNFSKFFVGSRNIAIIEGHGGPWRIWTQSNCCDAIDLPQIAGYGGTNGNNGVTDFIIWKSCSVIPAPGDHPGADYPEGASPIDVWRNVFKGLRGTYGYRTKMWPGDRVTDSFAFAIGSGAAILEAWFHATDTYRMGHADGQDYEYGNAVIVSGHEGDRAYDIEPLPGGHLTMWWQHPSL